MNKENCFFMDKALIQAQKALGKGEVPIGAVVVDATGTILARAYNKVEAAASQVAHAEVLAIQKACKKIGDWRLNGCVIYVTLEPCLMCLGLIQISRMSGVVYGAKSTLFGASLSDVTQLPTYAKGLVVQGGIREQESLRLLQSFFKDLREKS